MTVLQEEQEKPQIETGPTRHAKIMRGIVTPIFGLLAIACVVFGVLNSTVWKPDNEITAAAPVNGSEYVVTDPNVLQLVDSRVNISAKSRDKKSNVCIAIGSARDVAGWIAGSKYMRVSGLSDWTTLSTMKVSAQGTADNSQNQVAFKDSDMWRTIKCNDGAVDMQVKGSNSNNAEDVVALIDFGNRKGDTVTLNWDRRNLPNFAMPLYLAGGLLAILAVLSASVFAMPPHKRRNKRAFAMVEGVGVNEGDETEVSAWVKNADTAAKADELYDLLTGMGLDVLLDDREERPGVKFKDADLVGLPMQVVVGGKGLARGIVEVKNRKTGEKSELPVEGFAEAFAAWRKSVLACWGM